MGTVLEATRRLPGCSPSSFIFARAGGVNRLGRQRPEIPRPNISLPPQTPTSPGELKHPRPLHSHREATYGGGWWARQATCQRQRLRLREGDQQARQLNGAADAWLHARPQTKAPPVRDGAKLVMLCHQQGLPPVPEAECISGRPTNSTPTRIIGCTAQGNSRASGRGSLPDAPY